MRFDDSLKTVLAADTSTSFGARAAFRQLADLIARGRVPADAAMLARLEALRDRVPASIRAAIARSLALADPPAALVAFFAADEPDVAVAVLRAARLAPDQWDAIIPRLRPHGRSVLRRRDDLPPSAIRALESLGRSDFALPDGSGTAAVEEPPLPAEPPLAIAEPVETATERPQPGERFEIADLVSRIEAYQRDRGGAAPARRDAATPQVIAFRFETDAAGVIRWIDSAPRGAVIGLSLNHHGAEDAHVDGVAAGAYRKRTPFSDARLVVAGASPIAGDWRIAGVPAFEQATGRFVGYRGSARRPRIDEDAALVRATVSASGGEGLRRLVHELRTPTNAIAGFSELIERELLGPVPEVYRSRAAAIRSQVSGLIGAIEDLDLAARLEGDALDLRVGAVAFGPLLRRIAEDLAPLADRRGSAIRLPAAGEVALAADPVAAERLFSRLLATILSVTARGELLSAWLSHDAEVASFAIQRPRALLALDDATLFGLDDDGSSAATSEDAPLLGVGFALRLVRNLAGELGGRFEASAERLTVTMPTAFNAAMDQATTTAP